jgi:hypothetical protein
MCKIAIRRMKNLYRILLGSPFGKMAALKSRKQEVMTSW